MWVMPLNEFMKMAVFEPYEQLREAGRLVQWTPSMKNTWFLSHQWTSFSHPDPSGSEVAVRVANRREMFGLRLSSRVGLGGPERSCAPSSTSSSA